MRKHIKFSTHTFARQVQRTLGLTETCTLLARTLSRKDDDVFIYQVSAWVQGQYPQEAVVRDSDDLYFRLRGNVAELRLAMAERLLAAPNRVVYIKRGG